MVQDRDRTSRERLVAATARLLEQRGYFGTGLAEILESSGTPRGSLYFHFKGGKEELAAEAIRHAAGETCQALQLALEHAPDIGVAVERFVALLAGRLEASRFQQGCPVATVALEGVEGEGLRSALLGALDGWHAAIARRLEREQLPPARAAEVATFVLSAIEGALLLAKARHDTGPLQRAARELTLYLQRELAAQPVAPVAPRKPKRGAR
jgi:AcrR family transcriptional regulator